MRLLLLTGILFLTLTGNTQSYKKLHHKAILVDTHNDIPSAAIEKNVQFDSDLKGKTHSDLNRMKEGGVDVQVFSIFCGPEQPQPYVFANREIDSVYEWTRRNPDKMMIVKTPQQLKQALKEKKLATMMGVEGGHMMENKLEYLDKLYERGVRYMTLTWNNSTPWATSAADETAPSKSPPPDGGETLADSLKRKGLTDFGKQVVKRMNELGMIIDVSHVGEQTFWDAIHITTKPVIASHSCAWSLCPHRRNLKDDQIKAIGKNGGVIHLNFYAGFIDSTYEKKILAFLKQHKAEVDSLIRLKTQPDYAQMMVAELHKDEVSAFRPSLSVLLDHLDYIVKLIGVDHVGMGSDFDGIEAPPKELNGVEDYPLITKALLERGYSKKDIKKILGANFLRVFKSVQTL
jgi:membrane dipeptidase